VKVTINTTRRKSRLNPDGLYNAVTRIHEDLKKMAGGVQDIGTSSILTKEFILSPKSKPAVRLKESKEV